MSSNDIEHESRAPGPPGNTQVAEVDGCWADPHEPGESRRTCGDNEARHAARWAGHSQIVSHVLGGSYSEIRPPVAEFIPTIRCNYNHAFCSQRKQRICAGTWESTPPPGPATDMTDERAEHYLKTMAQGGVRAVLLTGGGEPTMAVNLSHIIACARELNLALGMITNATFNGDLRPENVIGPFDFVRISLNSLRHHAERCRYDPAGPDYREIVLKNIDSISQAKLANPGAETRLFMCTVFTRDTYHDLPDLAEVARDNSFSAWILRPAIVYYGGEQDQVQKDVLLRTEEKVNELRPMLADAGVNVYLPSHRRVSAGGAERHYTQCRAAGLIGGVSHTGEAFLCTETNYNEEFLIGDLNRQSWAEIYDSERYDQVVRKVGTSKCAHCPVTCRQMKLNALFETIEMLKTQPGGRTLLERWVGALHEEQIANGGPKPWIEI